MFSELRTPLVGPGAEGKNAREPLASAWWLMCTHLGQLPADPGLLLPAARPGAGSLFLQLGYKETANAVKLPQKLSTCSGFTGPRCIQVQTVSPECLCGSRFMSTPGPGFSSNHSSNRLPQVSALSPFWLEALFQNAACNPAEPQADLLQFLEVEALGVNTDPGIRRFSSRCTPQCPSI